ncbi:MAG: F0F1 ATP synthase subunit B [Phycisphaerae bacterium]|nr:F0F1 ATP synthase subunit B [Phycisphaerae bacterium]
MLITRFLLVGTGLAAVSPGRLLAAEGGGEGGATSILQPQLGTAVWTFVLFIVLLLFLRKFVWPQIISGLDAREGKIRSDIEAAALANEKAQQTLAEYEKKLADTHAETRGLMEQARGDAESLRQRLMADAEEDVTRLRQRATQEIEQAKQNAVQELYARSAELATAVASKVLQRQINEADAQGLVEESLSELERLDHAG